MNTNNTISKIASISSSSLKNLQNHLLSQRDLIEPWFDAQWHHSPAPFYASVDLRNADFKLAPVDTNLFPAGFNNLDSNAVLAAKKATQIAIEQLNANIKNILLIPENHTRNQFYLENLATIYNIIKTAGYNIHIGSLNPDISTTQDFQTTNHGKILIEPLVKHERQLQTINHDFTPDMLLLNNDLSTEVPNLLENIQQYITPPLESGWAKRLKSDHFSIYAQVAQEFADLIEIDPWLINPLFKNCGEINFMKKEGYECLADNVNALLNDIRQKYAEYKVEHPPFVIIKADAGSYGMGVMTVHDGEEIMKLNRKQRTRMSSTKGGKSISRVILQEGVYTFETWGEHNSVAEPVIYMIGSSVIGGFYRVHTKRGINENLNAPGMHFKPLAFHDSASKCNQDSDIISNSFYVYGVIARLALLAAAREFLIHN
ncbi:MAG: glutamate--cysteine ligase [Thiomargarita sp.]|nr:glutamate--cysteine ligase [Thiomargarita sp.]